MFGRRTETGCNGYGVDSSGEAEPDLHCIEEATRGLDSVAADVVTEVMHALTRQHNIAIITSIHQPNSDIIALFDGLSEVVSMFN